jgi:uncharacterized Zn-binding protein involved in type VI secretion
MGQPVCRIGDESLCMLDVHACGACPHMVRGPAATGSASMMVDGRPVVRIGDLGIHLLCCGANQWVAVEGSATVFVDGLPVVRMGDQTQHCGGTGVVMEGSSTVSIGGGTVRYGAVGESFLDDIPRSMSELAQALLQEMLVNLHGEDFDFIKSNLSVDTSWLIPFKGPVDHAEAFARWIKMVGPGGPWDYKLRRPFLRPSYDPVTGRTFGNDIWGNIHYGYVGRAAGISRIDLQAGAHAAQIVGSRRLDPRRDQEAIKIGMDLWEEHGENVTAGDILDSVRDRAEALQD